MSDIDAAIEELAGRLYWQQERLDPGLEDEVTWADLTDRQRRYYRLLIEDLARYPELWKKLDGRPYELWGSTLPPSHLLGLGRKT